MMMMMMEVVVRKYLLYIAHTVDLNRADVH